MCSNTLVDVRVPIMVDQVPVFRLAYGKLPLVWLRAPADTKGEVWIEVVSESRSQYPNVTVETDTEASLIRIKVVGHEVLAVATVSETKAKVSLIDFSVFGIPVVGNESGLQIGGNSLVGNVFAGSAVGFHLSLKGASDKQTAESQKQ